MHVTMGMCVNLTSLNYSVTGCLKYVLGLWTLLIFLKRCGMDIHITFSYHHYYCSCRFCRFAAADTLSRCSPAFYFRRRGIFTCYYAVDDVLTAALCYVCSKLRYGPVLVVEHAAAACGAAAAVLADHTTALRYSPGMLPIGDNLRHTLIMPPFLLLPAPRCAACHVSAACLLYTPLSTLKAGSPCRCVVASYATGTLWRCRHPPPNVLHPRAFMAPPAVLPPGAFCRIPACAR